MTNTAYHHGNLKQALIEAGIELIHQEGEKQLSLRKVAAMCSVSPAAPYSHFRSKEDLLDAMREYVTGQFMQALKETTQSSPEQDGPSVLLQMGKNYVMFFLKNPQYFSFLFSQSGIEMNLSLDGDSAGNFPPFELLKTNAVRILGATGMPKERLEDAIIALWSTVHGLTSLATMKNVHYDKDWEAKIVDIIWNR